jgi:hypothetical protein
MRDTNAKALPIFRINRGIGMQVDAFVLREHVYCCVRGLCAALELDYQKAVRITRANIRIPLTEALVIKRGLEQITLGIQPQDLQRWLDFRWRDGNYDNLTRLGSYWGTIWSDFAKANRICPANGFVGKETIVDGVMSRVPRHDHALTASSAEKAVAGRKGAEARWGIGKAITPDQIRELFRLLMSQSYESAAAQLGMAKSTAYGLAKGTYKLSEANEVAWNETFGGGRKSPPSSQPLPPKAPVLEKHSPAPEVRWGTVLTIYNVLKQGGSVEQAANRVSMAAADVQDIVTGHFWFGKSNTPLIWKETFGQDAFWKDKVRRRLAINRI